MRYMNIKRPKDIVHWDGHHGVFEWDVCHTPDSLCAYIGDDGTKIEILWAEEDSPVVYWGWSQPYSVRSARVHETEN